MQVLEEGFLSQVVQAELLVLVGASLQLELMGLLLVQHLLPEDHHLLVLEELLQ